MRRAERFGLQSSLWSAAPWGGGPHEVRWRGERRGQPLRHASHGPPPHDLRCREDYALMLADGEAGEIDLRLAPFRLDPARLAIVGIGFLDPPAKLVRYRPAVISQRRAPGLLRQRGVE